MPILLAILTALGGAIWRYIRSNPREAVDTVADVATTLANAPRRLAFRRQTTAHPVEGIDDARIAICAIAQSFIELDDLPTAEQRKKLHVLLRSKLRCDDEEAQEMEVLGRWLMTQCNGPSEAVTRLDKRLRRIDGADSWDMLQEMLMPLANDDLSAAQIDAIDDLKVALGK